ncbi:MAG: ATP-dependent DNA helicase, partial [Ilumatobacteraceae bacterium]
ALCDVLPAVSHISAHRWRSLIEQTADKVLSRCIDLDPLGAVERRVSDGRSVWIEPTAARYSSNEVLTQEEHILTWAMAAQADDPASSTTVERGDLDVAQFDAAASVAGHDRLVLVVGPAGTGKTRTLAAAAADLGGHGRMVFGLAPTAKAARVLERDTRMPADTVAKLLYEWSRADRAPEPPYRLSPGSTVVVDEASMVSTPDLYPLVRLAETQRWRLVLVGDHRQLQAVGRGGMFAELCLNRRVEELERLHRFTHPWEAAASLKLRSGDPRALDAYEGRDRIVAGPLDEHVERMAQTWISSDRRGDSVALVASTNDHVDAINRHVQAARLARYEIDPHWQAAIGGDEVAHGGDVVVTRRNDRQLITDGGHPVRNRETWTVDQVRPDGSLTVSQRQGHGTVVLPADYVQQHVRLGYAATEHGYQSDTVTTGIALTSSTTTRRGLYVAATRGRDTNLLLVVTDSNDVTEARNVLEGVLALDRADVPAVTQRRALAQAVSRPAAEATSPARLSPATQPRCPVPAWFDQLLDDTRQQAAADERSNDERHITGRRLIEQSNDARDVLRRVRAETAAARTEYAGVIRRLENAEASRRIAARVVDECGWRGRHRARQHLADADAAVISARSTL